jgi:curli biogenesis system outer membrane secretion channel CsgG
MKFHAALAGASDGGRTPGRVGVFPIVSRLAVRPAFWRPFWPAFWMAPLMLVAATALAQTPPALPAVVVWDFDNQSAQASVPGDRIDYLRRSLSEDLIAALLQVPGLPVVERQRLSELLSEQKLSSSALADADSRLRLGRIVGAARMVFGGFFVIGDQVQVNLRLVDTATSRVLFSDETTAGLAQVMSQVAPMNARLVQALGGGTVRDGHFSTETWQAYDRALALADAGQLDAAAQALQDLLARQPEFNPAERQLVAVLARQARR